MRFLIGILLISNICFSQEPIIPDGDTIFLDKNWKETDLAENASYYRLTSYNETENLLTVHDFFLGSNTFQMIGYYKGKDVNRRNQHGEFTFFYVDGSIKAVYNYSNGFYNGELKKYHPNGNLSSIYYYRNGVQIDSIIKYYPNGSLKSLEYINAEFDRSDPAMQKTATLLMTYVDSSGVRQISNGNGIYREYFLNGKTKLEIEYLHGLPHGNWTRYSGKRRKKIDSRMVFKNGRFIKGVMYTNGKKDVFSSLYRQTYYPSGIKGLNKFIEENTGQCPDPIKGNISVLVTVSTHGHVSFEQIISGNVNACQLEEIKLMVKNMPDWKPAIRDGRYIEGSFTMMVTY